MTAPEAAARPLVDAEARRRIREDLDATLVVEAAAGTGKTTELVQRILGLLRTGKGTLARLAAVTFTEKAAGEMKLRLREEIEEARRRAVLPEEEARFNQALAELEEAHIGTIHGFCADLLRVRPVEARVDPLFEVAAEDAQGRLYDECFDRWLGRTLADPPEGVRRILRRKTRDRYGTGGGPRRLLRDAGLKLIDQRDFDGAWTRVPFDRDRRIDEVFERVARFADVAPRAAKPPDDDLLAKKAREVWHFVEETRRRESTRARDHDGLEAELRALRTPANGWKYAGWGKMFGEGLPRADVVRLRDAAKSDLDAFVDDADADLAACLFAELRELVADYETLKSRAGKLDFLDLLVRTRDLLATDARVRRDLQARFSHLLVDEFQDTDPLQADILLLLAADDPDEADPTKIRPVPGKLFIVGDPKQSIYRFRRADVALYEAIKARLVARGAALLHLTTSFRSAPSIQAAVNAAFERVFARDPDPAGAARGSATAPQGDDDDFFAGIDDRADPSGGTTGANGVNGAARASTEGQARYVALQPHRADPVGRPTVIALPVPKPYGDYKKVTGFKIDESLPDAVGAFVDWLLRESGWTVSERERPGAPTPIEARHVCLLFKRFQSFGADVTRPYVRALEARRIPHVLMGGRSFYAREEVLAVKNALSAVEWPDDELSVFATLRGPFLALGDDALLAYRHAHGSLHPLRRVDPSVLTDLTRPVDEALAILGRLHAGRNRRPIADTLNQLLEATRAHGGIAIWPAGEQALGNVFRLLDRARRFEATGATSFRAFVRHLAAEAERGGAAEAPVVEEGTDGVRMMTVHKAKGLEFPVVVLVDPTAPVAPEEPSRYVEAARKIWAMPLAGCKPRELIAHRAEVLREDEQEGQRLLYVAATRARDLLVVPVVGDEKWPGWLGALDPAIWPRSRRDSRDAEGTPRFGEDTVLERPPNVTRDTEDAVRPGLHAPEAGTHGVVWWDPRALVLDKDDAVGLRQQRILAADEIGVASDGERAHAAWQARRSAVAERGAQPSVRVTTVTALASPANTNTNTNANAPPIAPSAPPVPVAHHATDASRSTRPHGKRFGTLVHAALATVDLAGDAAAVLRATRAHARRIGATDDEIAAAADAVGAALAHPLIARARASRSCRRESAVTLMAADGTLVEGVLDLAFVDDAAPEGPRWVVVDFKTDVEVAGRAAAYDAQVARYADAVAAATGLPAVAVLFSV